MFSSRTRALGALALALLLAAGLMASLRCAAMFQQGLRRHLAGEPGQQLRIESLRVNPLTLTGTLRGLQVDSPDGVRVLNVEQATFRLALASLFGRSLTLRALDVQRPQLNLTLDADAVPRWQPALLQVEPDAPPLNIDAMSVSGGQVRVSFAAGASSSAVAEAVVHDIALKATQFDPRGMDAASVDLAASVGGGALRAVGDVDLQQRVLAAAVTVEAIALKPWLPLLRRLDVAGLTDGTLSASGELSVGEGGARFDGGLALQDLRAAAVAGRPSLEADEVRFDAVSLGGRPLCLVAPGASLLRPRMDIVVGVDIGQSVARLLGPVRSYQPPAPREAGASTAGEAGSIDFSDSTDSSDSTDATDASNGVLLACAASAASADATTRAWSIGRLSIDGGQFGLLDIRHPTPVRWPLREVSGHITNVADAGARVLDIALAATLDEQGALRLASQHGVEVPAEHGRGTLTLSNVDVARLAGYVPERLERRLSAGRIDWVASYRINDGMVSVDNELTARGLVVVPRTRRADAAAASPRASSDQSRAGSAAGSEAGSAGGPAAGSVAGSGRGSQPALPSASPAAATAQSLAAQRAKTTDRSRARRQSAGGVSADTPAGRLAGAGDEAIVADDAGLGAGQRVDLALMLLTDTERNAKLSFATGETIAADAGVAWWTSLDAALATLTAQPALAFARLLDPDAIEPFTLAFGPGDTALSAAALPRLVDVREVLARRPLLQLGAHGFASPVKDSPALARRQLRLHVTLASSARPSATNEPAAIDFSDPKVQVVLDEFAGERLDERTRLALAELPGGKASGPAARGSYYEQVYAELARKESVSDRALRQLARYRALGVSNELRRLGVPPARLSPATAAVGDAAVMLAPDIEP